MDENFLLKTKTARELYHNFAAKQKIIDYHCHINPAEIAADRKWRNITELWLGGDHYKWRLMRAAGVDEKYITGSADDFDKFIKYAGVLSKAIGNPLYHWSHLELKYYFGYAGNLSADTAVEVWEITRAKLASDAMSAKNIIKNSDVETLCTTDDPADSLKSHEEIAKDASFGVSVLPAWRPDNAVNIEKDGFSDYLDTLSNASGVNIKSYSELRAALKNRMEYFNAHGCKTSDHGLVYTPYADTLKNKRESEYNPEIERLFSKRQRGELLDDIETKMYKSALMLFLGEQYARLNWVMQLHIGCKRNNNTKMFKKLGADTGYDCIYDNSWPLNETAEFLNALEEKDALPKTIIYSLNPNDNAAIATIAGCFQGGEIKSKIQHGSAWWFNDNKRGMYEQLENLANIGYLAGFVGMLTDSRSFVSYPRHEYFRRILCDFLGRLVENGEFPNDLNLLGEIVSDISYNNVKEYFGF